ncbi:Carbohydrate-binding protein [Phytophthora palmivora]|uniref:Carbohydrate-binding protein n=1 Tax=Phytophthora palmivora TaxID=4796 RepID=A0A2P4Y7X5_9STRA|nr:Carbohydrate-binding protein [Phytophthora palmivora]
MSGKVQVSIILALNVLFFFYLEIQSPHHSKFVQTTTSFVSIMKIAVLVLTFFLITAATSDGFPTSLQNGISVAIVGLNLFVLALLMVRSLYTFWQKMKLQRDAAYDQEEQTAQDYFKDETPAGSKDRAPSNAQHPSGQPVLQSQYSNVNNNNNNPYVQGNAAVDYNTADEIRLRSATHENDDRQQTYDTTRNSAANHYITQDRNTYGQRRNDVGLEPLASKSKALRNKLDELYTRDHELQTAHQQAKRDDDFGEEVVTKYKAFLSCRQQLISELEKQNIQVPWQLRMTIDDLELTLKQRREKKEGKTSSTTKIQEVGTKQSNEPEPIETVGTVQSGRVTVAFVGPTLIALVIAMLWYYYNV